MKRGQLKLSFGMIFSIILIIIFISLAFFAINKFLDVQNTIQVGKFGNNFQLDVDKIWKGSQGSEEKKYTLPKKIVYICFVDYSSEKKGEKQDLYRKIEQLYYENENMFFYPIGSAQGLNAKEIKHIDLEKIIENENPFCIENIDGKVGFIIKKDFGEALVTIEATEKTNEKKAENEESDSGEVTEQQTQQETPEQASLPNSFNTWSGTCTNFCLSKGFSTAQVYGFLAGNAVGCSICGTSTALGPYGGGYADCAIIESGFTPVCATQCRCS